MHPLAATMFRLPTVVSSSAPKRSAQKMRMPPGFAPGDYTVICGRGKLYSAYPGNRHLRVLINESLVPYSNAKTKQEKSSIVAAIMNRVREASPVGAFVKQDELCGDWWEVDDSFAREKIGCIFRDMLHKQYRSSTKSKHARKKKQALDESSGKPSTAAKSKKATSKVSSPSKGSSSTKKQNKTTALSTDLEPLPLFEIKNDQASSFTRVVSQTSVRSTDEMLMSAPMRDNIQCWTKNQNLMGNGRPVRYDVQAEMPMPSPLVASSSQAVVDSFRRNALSLVLEEVLETVDLEAILGEDEEVFPDDLSNIFDDDIDP